MKEYIQCKHYDPKKCNDWVSERAAEGWTVHTFSSAGDSVYHSILMERDVEKPKPLAAQDRPAST